MAEAKAIGQIMEKIPSIKPDIRDYDHIELTAEETTAAILEAKIRKAVQIETEQKELAYKRHIEEIMKPKDYAALRAMVLEKARSLPFYFEVDSHNKNVMRLLCLYFSNDPQFEKEGFYKDNQLIQQYSLKKGICLYSSERGTGKTVLMQLFNQNSKSSFVVIPTKNIAAFYQAEGGAVIDKYSRPWECLREARFLYQSPVGICFDDLGDEQVKNNFGNKENVMQRVLQQVYDSDPGKERFKYFHATTNLTGDQMEEMYDTRVRSRMREIFNWIELSGSDRRK